MTGTAAPAGRRGQATVPRGNAAGGIADFGLLAAALRPKLHRYCARMTGSVVDGEDVVQDALAKAVEAFPSAGRIEHPEGWVFRIAHNAALDFLRRRTRLREIQVDEVPDMIADPTGSSAEDRQIAAASLRTFMRLPVAQRSSVILMDVLGYSLKEIGEVLDITLPAVKAALHRGRARLRDIAGEPEDRAAPALGQRDRAVLAAYVDRFNARDFDAIRDMLADEVRLDLVARERMSGRREVSRYFGNYARVRDWHFRPGLVEGRPAVIVEDPADRGPGPAYFILLTWVEGGLIGIRDFRYARYACETADIRLLN